jgi:hypothetical protein
MPPDFGPVRPGKHVTVENDRVPIPRTVLPDGRPALLFLADIEVLSEMEPRSTFVELDAIDVMRMAIRERSGIVVQSDLPGQEAWAGISENDVVYMFRELGGR